MERLRAAAGRGVPRFVSGDLQLRQNQWVVVVSNDPVYVALPASPQAGWWVEVGRAGRGTVTVGRSGATILGLAEDFVLDVEPCSAYFVYDGTTWRVQSTGGWA